MKDWFGSERWNKWLVGLTSLILFSACEISTPHSPVNNKSQSTTRQYNPEIKIMQTVQGSFEVKMNPIEDKQEFELEKIYTGPLSATATGKMLMTYGAIKGSASYVAIETVTGQLNGKSGSFVLVHRGVMHAGKKELSVTISSASGTQELSGISGDLEIQNENGKHSYSLNYSLPD